MMRLLWPRHGIEDPPQKHPTRPNYLTGMLQQPASDCSSRLDATFLLTHSEIIALSLANLYPGSRSCIAIVSTSIPTKSRHTAGPTFSPPQGGY